MVESQGILKSILSDNPVEGLLQEQWQFSCHQISCQFTLYCTVQHGSGGSRGGSEGSLDPPPPASKYPKISYENGILLSR